MTSTKKSVLSISTMVIYSAGSFGTNMVNAFSNFALPMFLSSYGLQAWLIGLLAQERSSLGGIEQPIIGRISDRVRTRWGKRRPFFIVGSLLVVLSLIFLSTHPPFWAVVINLFLFSSFLALANDPYQALMADLFPPEQRGRVGAASSLANMLGQIAFLLLAARLWEINEALAFYVVGGGLVLGFGITFFGIREPDGETASVKHVGLGFRHYLGEIFSHREFTKYSLSQTFYWFGVGGAVPFLTRFGVVVLGLSEGDAFLITLVLVISTSIFTMPAGILGDRLGKKRVLGCGLAFFAIVAIVGSQARSPLQGVLVMAVIGIANAMTTTVSFPLFTEMMPQHRLGEFTGFSAFVTSISQAIGAVLVGLFVDLTGNYRAVFIVTGILIGISFLLLQRVHPDRSPLPSADEQVVAEPAL